MDSEEEVDWRLKSDSIASLNSSFSDQPSLMRNFIASKMVKRNKSAKRSSKTGFESFLEMDTRKDASAHEDFELERKLAKKLRVKGGKLGGEEDEFNLLFEYIPSVLDSLGEEGITKTDEFSVKQGSLGKKRKKRKPAEQLLENGTYDEDLALEEAPDKVRSRKKHKKKKKKKKELLEQDHEGGMVTEAETAAEEAPAKATALKGSGKYVAPHLRSRAGNGSAEHHQIRRRVRGMESFSL